MARTAICGFEMGTLQEGTLGGVGGISVTSAVKRTGGYCLQMAPSSGAVANLLIPGASGAYMRFYFRPNTLPSTARRIAYSTGNCFLVWNTDGTIQLRTGSDGNGRGTSVVTLTDTSRWYLIEIMNLGSGAELAGWIDGQKWTDGGNNDQGTATAPTAFGTSDTVAGTYIGYVDDAVWDNAELPGAGAVVMLLPTSLNAANGWVEGDGAGTAGMAAAVATRPPPGVASASETSATNIESSTNSATDNCDMNMTTYIAAGIGISDTVQAVQGIIRHGEDIATNTKAGALQIVSNPAQGAEDGSWNYGNDGGAHGAEGSGGFWVTQRGTVQDSPSVTKGTAPVFRVGKRTATTRTVCVDFMGIYVDFSKDAPSWTVSSGMAVY